MYAWIWRHLPFRHWALKLATSLVLIAGVGALLWYVLFPWAEPLLPFDDVQVEQESGVPADPGIEASPSAPADEYEIPYDTETNNPDPSATPTR